MGGFGIDWYITLHICPTMVWLRRLCIEFPGKTSLLWQISSFFNHSEVKATDFHFGWCEIKSNFLAILQKNTRFTFCHINSWDDEILANMIGLKTKALRLVTLEQRRWLSLQIPESVRASSHLRRSLDANTLNPPENSVSR